MCAIEEVIITLVYNLYIYSYTRIRSIIHDILYMLLQIGGATARIGDPSGKTEERPQLEYETMKENIRSIKQSLERIFHNYNTHIDRTNNKTTPM